MTLLIICYPIACSVTQLLVILSLSPRYILCVLFSSQLTMVREYVQICSGLCDDDNAMTYICHIQFLYLTICISRCCAKCIQYYFICQGVCLTFSYLFIANRIEDFTDNIRVGFGSFNDKLTRPYAYIPVPPADGGSCPICDVRPPRYAFRHQITLTDNITFYNVCISKLCVPRTMYS